MGMFVHITRRKFWAVKQKGCDITADEWREYVRSDSELRMPGTGGLDFADWLVSPGRWLGWMDGEICAERPDSVFIAKMQAIARRFDAIVQDDDGTIYRDTTAA
jgi:hypothetical protein